MNWNGCRRKWPWPNLRRYLEIFSEGRRRITKDISQDSWCNDREWNWAPPEYQSEALPLEPIG
jgi:hypothetical protein